jgi:uncharacterized protein (TIGR00299 family) protein
MILGCLFDLGFDKADLLKGIEGLGLEGVEIEVKEVLRQVLRSCSVEIRFPKDQPQRNHKDIAEMIKRSDLSIPVRRRALRAFDILADAEGRVHGIPKEKIHFHEVGAVDSIVDVVGAFIGLEALGIEEVFSSPLVLGSGTVECQHGTLPVPAPATVEIMRGLPARGGGHLTGERTTPTGAAILKAAASTFGPMPEMTVSATGYGAGSRDPEELPNVMRFMVGEMSTGQRVGGGGDALGFDRLTMIETNIDDMNPEYFSHIYDDLFEAGALDVWVTPVLMKKGRPGFVLSVLAEDRAVGPLTLAILSGTTTSGLRVYQVGRFRLSRKMVEVDTRFGKVRVKVFDFQSKERCAPEYEDCLRISRAESVSIADVVEEARNAFKDTLKDKKYED